MDAPNRSRRQCFGAFWERRELELLTYLGLRSRKEVQAGVTEEEEAMAGAEAGVKGVEEKEEKEAMVEEEGKEEGDLVVAVKGEEEEGGEEEEEVGEGEGGEGAGLVGGGGGLHRALQEGHMSSEWCCRVHYLERAGGPILI